MRNGSWKEFKKDTEKKGKSPEWRIHEAYEKVAKDEIGRLGIVQEFLRRARTSCGGSLRQSVEWRNHFVVCRPHCNSFPLEELDWWVYDGTRRRQHCGRVPQAPITALNNLENPYYSLKVFAKSHAYCKGLQVGWHEAFCKRCGKDSSGKASGLTWTRGTACACARRPLTGTFQEVWAAWRALFLPHKEGAGGGFK